MKRSALFAAVFSVFFILASYSAQQDVNWDENERKRDERYQLDKALDSVGIKPGMTVAEVGSG